jgi:hypothetical protein
LESAEGEEFTILLIAKGQDEIYYRINSQDYPSEAEASEQLLAPLLEFIEAEC